MTYCFCSDCNAEGWTCKQAQAQENDLEGAKTVHKLLHIAKAADGGLALREDDSEDDFGEDAQMEEQEAVAAGEEGEVEEI